MREKSNPNDPNTFSGNFSQQDSDEANELLRDFFTSEEMLDPDEGYVKGLPERLFVDPDEEESDEANELLRDLFSNDGPKLDPETGEPVPEPGDSKPDDAETQAAPPDHRPDPPPSD